MCAVPADDEQGRLDLLRPLHDHLEWLAHEDLRLDRNVGKLLRHDLGALQERATCPPSCEYGWRPCPWAPMATRSYLRPDEPTSFAASSSSSATIRPFSPSRTSLRVFAPPS